MFTSLIVWLIVKYLGGVNFQIEFDFVAGFLLVDGAVVYCVWRKRVHDLRTERDGSKLYLQTVFLVLLEVDHVGVLNQVVFHHY